MTDRSVAAALLAVTIATTTCASCAARQPAPAPPDSSALADAQERRAVALIAVCPQPGGGAVAQWGSASVVALRGSHARVLTATHVVNCAKPLPGDPDPVPRRYQSPTAIVAQDWVGTVHAARVVMMDMARDAAVLEVDGPVPGATAAELGAAPGDGAWVCLQSAVPERARACGRVRGVDDSPDMGLAHGAKTVPGNSGSGLYDDRGRLVGVVTRALGTGVGGRASRADALRWAVAP